MPGQPLHMGHEHDAQGSQGRGLAGMWAGCILSSSRGKAQSAAPCSQAHSTAHTCPHILLLTDLTQPPCWQPRLSPSSGSLYQKNPEPEPTAQTCSCTRVALVQGQLLGGAPLKKPRSCSPLGRSV